MPKPLKTAVLALALGFVTACSGGGGDGGLAESGSYYGIDREGGLNMNRSQTDGRGAIESEDDGIAGDNAGP